MHLDESFAFSMSKMCLKRKERACAAHDARCGERYASRVVLAKINVFITKNQEAKRNHEDHAHACLVKMLVTVQSEKESYRKKKDTCVLKDVTLLN